MSDSLPSVFRGCAVDEDDPAVLAGQARALWERWQALAAGAPKQGYSKTTVKAAIVQLVEQYVSAELPIPYELGRLVRAVLTGKLKKSDPGKSDVENVDTVSPVQAAKDEAYWAAILFEADLKADQASVYAVAKHLFEGKKKDGKPLLGSSSLEAAKATVTNWWKIPHYKTHVRLYRRRSPK
ncbi:hypothetical protein [Mesorhizobium sp. M0847]|uniref:hypothetical protein n=1 Tax=unclassified Mesorhizobium TaxID=325217 RepID=UPI00333C799D